ncbi:MAG: hypothetical protein U1D33_03090, partial [bacterium]|nr:hypothetical protein [bacterium]
GAGPTLRTRSGQEKRDGYMRLQEAQSRFYLTNLMHYLGLRTSLGVAVVNLNLPRTGDYKTETTFHNRAIVYEMRREQLRLDQLNSPNWRFVIDIVKNKIALELKKEKLTDEEYVIFLAETFGEQLAIMRFYGFDHGLSGIPGQKQARTTQLHPGNPSLVGEIKDFDAARLTRDRDMLDRRYIGGEDNFSDGDLNFKNIKRMQREWKKNDPKNSKIWLHTLLNIAPEVDFYSLFQAAYKKKRLALESSGIDPAQKIREFNVNYWNPYMRSLKRIRSG